MHPFLLTTLLPGGGLILFSVSCIHRSSTSLFLSYLALPSSCPSLCPLLHLALLPLLIHPNFLPVLCARSSSVPFFLLLPLLVFPFFFLSCRLRFNEFLTVMLIGSLHYRCLHAVKEQGSRSQRLPLLLLGQTRTTF